MKTILITGLLLCVCGSLTFGVDVVLDSMTGSISTAANDATGLDYEYDYGNVIVDLDACRPYGLRIRGEVTNLNSYTTASGTWPGSWNFISLTDQDYVAGGLAPHLGGTLDMAGELQGNFVMVHVDDPNYGGIAYQRGFGANAAFSVWYHAGGDYYRFAAEDHYSGVLTGHKQDISGSTPSDDIEFETDYYWVDDPSNGWNRKFKVRGRGIGEATWLESDELNAGARQDYDLLSSLGEGAELEDWSAVVMTVMSANNLTQAQDPGGLGFDYDIELVIFDVWPGDVNLDGVTNGHDEDVVTSNMGMPNPTFMDGDADQDGDVDADDLAVVQGARPNHCVADPTDPNDPGGVVLAADIQSDCYVNEADLAILASQWLNCTDPCNTDCDPYWRF